MDLLEMNVEINGIRFLIGPRSSADRGLVLFHHRSGLDAFTLRMVRRLDEAGFRVVAPDLFAHLPDGQSPDELKNRLDDEFVLTSAIEGSALLAREGVEKPGAIGFCMGGRLAFLAGAAGLVSAAVSFYGGDLDAGRLGGRTPLARMSARSAPLQLHRGSRDSAATAEAQAAAVSTADRLGTYLEACTYAGARHAFLNSDDQIRFSAAHSRRAWNNALVFLDDHLGSGSESGEGGNGGEDSDREGHENGGGES
jgi:carboxymethylenebutenolidase